jgi:hypothetical protein
LETGNERSETKLDWSWSFVVRLGARRTLMLFVATGGLAGHGALQEALDAPLEG